MTISNLFSGGETPPVVQDTCWYQLTTNQATKHVDIYLFGVIGSYRVNARKFLDELQAAGDVSSITVYLNTVGGNFYDGLPIYNTLKQHKAHVTIKIMGYALSMGSVIMLAGNAIEAAENSMIMIHRARGFVSGDADDMVKMAEVMRKHEAGITPEYMRRMNKTAEEVQALLAAETWFTAPEAKAAGLIDTISGAVERNPEAASMREESLSFANQHFQNIPNNFNHYINQEDTEMTEQELQAIINGVAEKLGGKLDKLNDSINAVAEFQPKMASDIKRATDVLDEVKNLPVNNFTPPDYVNDTRGGGSFL